MKAAGKSSLKDISIRCFAELNDFLPAERKQNPFNLSLKEPVTAGEAILGIGIPLSEVDLVTVNGQPVERSYRLQSGDHVSVYPTFEVLDISSIQTIHKDPIRITRFILDAHLGKLASYLRMLGFDTLYRNDFGDEEIIVIAAREHRIILTRDKLLLRSPKVQHGYYVRSTRKHDQLVEVVKKFDLYSQFKTFTRCMSCNAYLLPVDKETFSDRIDPEVYCCFEVFTWCPACDKLFWKGSHFERMEQLILRIISTGKNPSSFSV